MRYLLLPLLLMAVPCSAQWTRDEALPESEVPSLLPHGTGLFVGGVGTVHHQPSPGAPWEAWNTIPEDLLYVDALAHFGGSLFAGTGGSAMYRCNGAGSPWVASPGLVGLGSSQVSCIAEFQGTLYCGTMGGGTFRLVNDTWQPFGALGDDQANNVYFLRAIGDTLWCGGGGNGYLFRISAGATDWTPVPVDVVAGLSIEFTDIIDVPGALVAGGTMGTYRSTDHGVSWTWTAGPAGVVKFTWWNDVLIASRTGGSTRWFRSNNNGLSWEVFSETTLSFAHVLYNGRFYSGQLDGLWYMENLPTTVNDPDPIAFELYPIPAQERITLRMQEALPNAFQILDPLGRTVLSGTTFGLSETIDISHLPAGPHILRLSTKTGERTIPFVIQ